MEAMSTILQEKGYDLGEVICKLSSYGIPDELLSRVIPLELTATEA